MRTITTIVVLALLLAPLYEASRIESEENDMDSSDVIHSLEDKDSLEYENDEAIRFSEDEFSHKAIAEHLTEDEQEGDNSFNSETDDAAIEAAESRSSVEAHESQTLTPEQIRSKLPFDRSQTSINSRRSLFNKIDGNGNGKLSLAEIEAGVRKEVGTGMIGPSGLAPVLMRAYQVARDYYGKGADMRAVAGEEAVRQLKMANLNQATVNRKEFRILLEYIYKYALIYKVFSKIDKNFDRKISRAEYTTAEKNLKAGGFPYPAFGDIDIDNGGTILFDEFAAYMIMNSASENASQE